MNTKSHKAVVALLIATAALAGAPSFAAGVGKMTITTEGDQFINTGKISSTSESSGGVSTSIAGQRIIAPLLAITFDYRSSGNRYVNTGEITASSRSSGGVSTAVAGQDIVH
jgi:hypothetical protein